MQQGPLSWIANFIWGIADDVLRDPYVRGKYRDVILPMTALRRLDKSAGEQHYLFRQRGFVLALSLQARIFGHSILLTRRVYSLE